MHLGIGYDNHGKIIRQFLQWWHWWASAMRAVAPAGTTTYSRGGGGPFLQIGGQGGYHKEEM